MIQMLRSSSIDLCSFSFAQVTVHVVSVGDWPPDSGTLMSLAQVRLMAALGALTPALIYVSGDSRPWFISLGQGLYLGTSRGSLRSFKSADLALSLCFEEGLL